MHVWRHAGLLVCAACFAWPVRARESFAPDLEAYWKRRELHAAADPSKALVQHDQKKDEISDDHGASSERARTPEDGDTAEISSSSSLLTPHDHSHHTSSSSLLTTSCLLIGFLAANFIMLWFVNWPDPHIRSLTWKMISGTVSIYLAVLLNGSLSSAAIYAIKGLLHPNPESECWMLVVIHTVLFFSVFSVGNVICYLWRSPRTKDILFSTQVIGGHITAFAGIGAVKAVLHVIAFNWINVLLLALGWLTVNMLLRVASRAARVHWLGLGVENPDRRMAMMMGKQEKKEKWRHHVVVAEDDACAIIGSFCISSVVCAAFFGSAGSHGMFAGGEDNFKNAVFVEIGCGAALVVLTVIRKRVEEQRKYTEYTFTMRGINSVMITAAMTMSWVALDLFCWLTQIAFPEMEHAYVKIASAAILTAFGVAAILALDMVADKAQEAAQQQEQIAQPAPLKEVHAKTDANCNIDLGDLGCMLDDGVNEALDAENLEEAMRVLIEAVSLAVGLAWEHAFHAALHTITLNVYILKHHEVLANSAMALFNCALILPPWLKLIVPMANRNIKYFEERIEAENLAARMPTDVDN